jgi:hypothetical protein
VPSHSCIRQNFLEASSLTRFFYQLLEQGYESSKANPYTLSAACSGFETSLSKPPKHTLHLQATTTHTPPTQRSPYTPSGSWSARPRTSRGISYWASARLGRSTGRTSGTGLRRQSSAAESGQRKRAGSSGTRWSCSPGARAQARGLGFRV